MSKVGVLVTVAPFSHKLCYPETVSTLPSWSCMCKRECTNHLARTLNGPFTVSYLLQRLCNADWAHVWTEHVQRIHNKGMIALLMTVHEDTSSHYYRRFWLFMTSGPRQNIFSKPLLYNTCVKVEFVCENCLWLHILWPTGYCRIIV